MNRYSVTLIGDAAGLSAAAGNELMRVLGNLYIIKDNDENESVQGLVAATQANHWEFSSIYQFDMPATTASVIYRQLKVDTVATKKLTTIQKSTLVEGDLAFVISTATYSNELNSYTYQSLLLSTGPVIFQVGQASDTQSTIYSPFTSTANLGKAYFQRSAVEAVLTQIQAAKGLRAASAISIIQDGYV